MEVAHTFKYIYLVLLIYIAGLQSAASNTTGTPYDAEESSIQTGTSPEALISNRSASEIVKPTPKYRPKNWYLTHKTCIADKTYAITDSTKHVESMRGRYENCTTIIGDLQINEIKLPDADLSFFKELRILYGTLNIQRNLIKRLVFPNLLVIHADEHTRQKYHPWKDDKQTKLKPHPGFVLKIMNNDKLKTLEFPQLREIHKGAVLIAGNPNWCGDRIDWEDLGIMQRYGGVINCDYNHEYSFDEEENPGQNLVRQWSNIACQRGNLLKHKAACGPTQCSKECKKSSLLTETISLIKPAASLEPQRASCYSTETCQSPSFKKPCPFCKDNDRIQVGCLRNISKLTDIECCDAECLGGCFGIGPTNCVVCKNDYMDLGNGTIQCVPSCPDLHTLQYTANRERVVAENPAGRYTYGRNCVKKCPDSTYIMEGKCVAACMCGYKLDGNVCQRMSISEMQENKTSCERCRVGQVTREQIEKLTSCIHDSGGHNITIEGDVIFGAHFYREGITKAELAVFNNVIRITGKLQVLGMWSLDSNSLGDAFLNLEEIGGRVATDVDITLAAQGASKTKTLELRLLCQRGLSLGLRKLHSIKEGHVWNMDTVCLGGDAHWHYNNVPSDIRWSRPPVMGDREAKYTNIGVIESHSKMRKHNGTLERDDFRNHFGSYQIVMQACPTTLVDMLCSNTTLDGFWDTSEPNFYTFIQDEFAKRKLNIVGDVCQEDLMGIGYSTDKARCLIGEVIYNITYQQPCNTLPELNDTLDDAERLKQHMEWKKQMTVEYNTNDHSMNPLDRLKSWNDACPKCDDTCATNMLISNQSQSGNFCWGPGPQECIYCAPNHFKYRDHITRDDLCLPECVPGMFGNTTTWVCDTCHSLCEQCSGPNHSSDCQLCKNGSRLYKDSNVRRCVSQCSSTSERLIRDASGQRICEQIFQWPIELTVVFFLLPVIVILLCIIKKYRQKNLIQKAIEMREIVVPLVSNNTSNRSKLVILPATDLKRKKQLGSGQFGTVWSGEWHNLAYNVNVPVAIKELNMSADTNSNSDFMNEAMAMANCDHPHLVKIIGICIPQNGEPQLVSNLELGGSLLAYLSRKRRDLRRVNRASTSSSTTSRGTSSSFERIRSKLLSYCHQVTLGMIYLQDEKSIVHRDLACRNLLLNRSHDHVKITDFGLSKMTEAGEFKETKPTMLPVKWLAPESIENAMFTHKSDVWAYGVTVWEILTMGDKPWQGVLNATQLVGMLRDGRRLPQPEIASLEVWVAMVSCWQYDVAQRSTFKELSNNFSGFAKDPNRYLNRLFMHRTVPFNDTGVGKADSRFPKLDSRQSDELNGAIPARYSLLPQRNCQEPQSTTNQSIESMSRSSVHSLDRTGRGTITFEEDLFDLQHMAPPQYDDISKQRQKDSALATTSASVTRPTSVSKRNESSGNDSTRDSVVQYINCHTILDSVIDERSSQSGLSVLDEVENEPLVHELPTSGRTGSVIKTELAPYLNIANGDVTTELTASMVSKTSRRSSSPLYENGI